MADESSKKSDSLPRRGLSGSATATGSGSGSGTSAGSSKASKPSGTGATRPGATSNGSGSAGPTLVERARQMIDKASDNLTEARNSPRQSALPKPGREGKDKPAPKATRRARLRLTRLDPWSVAKTAFLLSIAVGIVTVVAVAVVWSVLDAAGVWDSINSMVYQVVGGDTSANFDVQNYLGTSRVLGFTMIVAGVDVLLITAIATLGAFVYNVAAALLGGIEVTLAEDPR